MTPIDVKGGTNRGRTEEQEKLNVRFVSYNNEKNSYRYIKHGQFGWSRKKACKVNGKIYESIAEAAKGEGVFKTTIQNKLKKGVKGYEYD